MEEAGCSDLPDKGGVELSFRPPEYLEPPLTSPSIPEPPPPPKNLPPNQSGILRTPQTPSTMKKRVQIQEISV